MNKTKSIEVTTITVGRERSCEPNAEVFGCLAPGCNDFGFNLGNGARWDLTSSSSATASEGAAGYLLQCFNHKSGRNKPARRRLQRLVRCNAFHHFKRNTEV